MNDFVRDKFTDHGHIPLYGEIIAGACGGASQVRGEIWDLGEEADWESDVKRI